MNPKWAPGGNDPGPWGSGYDKYMWGGEFVEVMLESIVHHAKVCSVCVIQDHKQPMVGFECECGKTWKLNVKNWRVKSASTHFTEVMRSTTGRIAICEFINDGKTVEEIKKLAEVHEIMAS